MNIGIDVRTLMTPFRTGVGEYTYELLKAVFSVSTEEEFFLLYNGQKSISQYLPDWRNNRVHYSGTTWPNKLFNANVALFKSPQLTSSLPQTTKLDLVFLPNINFTALPPKTKYILTVHDLSFLLFPKFFSLKQRLWHKFVRPEQLIRNATAIITPSDNTRRDAIERLKISSEKVTTVYPGLCSDFSIPTETDRSRIKKKYQLPNNFILFLGTIEPRKNIVGLIESFIRLKKNGGELVKDTELVIAGAEGWNDSAIKQLIKNTPQVRSIGFVSEADKSALYSLAKVFVYPSFYEGFGFPVLEAMSVGTPVITSNRSSLPEITNGAASLVDPYAVHEMTEALQLLLTNETARNLYSARGFEQAAKFSWNKTAREFLDICKKT